MYPKNLIFYTTEKVIIRLEQQSLTEIPFFPGSNEGLRSKTFSAKQEEPPCNNLGNKGETKAKWKISSFFPIEREVVSKVGDAGFDSSE